MFTLFHAGTLLDNVTGVVQTFWNNEGGSGYAMLAFMILYILISAFVILNMLIGVLCEVVSTTTQDENEKTMVLDTQARLEKVYKMMDADHSNTITYDEFKSLCDNKEFQSVFFKIGVETKHFSALASVLFEDVERHGKTRPLTFPEFVKQIVALRPEKAASVIWAANKRFEILKLRFKFPRARTYEIIGLVLGCIEAKFCK